MAATLAYYLSRENEELERDAFNGDLSDVNLLMQFYSGQHAAENYRTYWIIKPKEKNTAHIAKKIARGLPYWQSSTKQH